MFGRLEKCFILGRISHATMFSLQQIIKKCTTYRPLGLLQVHKLSVQSSNAEAQVGDMLYIFDDLLKRNIVTCDIRPKIKH